MAIFFTFFLLVSTLILTFLNFRTRDIKMSALMGVCFIINILTLVIQIMR